MKIFNRKATYDFEILDKFEAGIHLTGPEVKAIRLGHVDLAASYVRIVGSEAYLVNAKIYPYQYARTEEKYDASRSRKLLLHKKEIISLKSKLDGERLSLVPLSLYTTRRMIKLELALGKGKKAFQKREAIKKRDIERDVVAELEERYS